MTLIIEWANHACQMVLLKDMHMNYWLCPEGNKKRSRNKYKKQLEDEVGMAGPKSAQTRFVGIITSTVYIPIRLLFE
jgi:aryl-phospho-beta-D-glucosidase BglC (GH1 family)